MEKRSVVVTGIGAITPLGNDTETTWNNLVAGVSGIGPLTRVNADDFPAKVAAEVKDFDPSEIYGEKRCKKNGSIYTICCCSFYHGCKRCWP